MIQLREVEYSYGQSAFRLAIPSLTIEQGEKVALVGPSGSGKSTLLHLISGALVCRSGAVEVDGVRIDQLRDHARRRYRVSTIGFIFQDFELIEYLSVRENILLPFLINSSLRANSKTYEYLQQLVCRVGLSDKTSRLPHQLSTGERQRVALCRALITKPKRILADEPTGSLDPKTADEILSLLVEQSSQSQATLLMVTHDHRLLGRMDRIIHMAEFTSGNSESTEGA